MATHTLQYGMMNLESEINGPIQYYIQCVLFDENGTEQSYGTAALLGQHTELKINRNGWKNVLGVYTKNMPHLLSDKRSLAELSLLNRQLECKFYLASKQCIKSRTLQSIFITCINFANFSILPQI